MPNGRVPIIWIRREQIVIIPGVKHERAHDLAQVVQAPHALGPGAGVRVRRQQEQEQEDHDTDHHEQFSKGKGPLRFATSATILAASMRVHNKFAADSVSGASGLTLNPR